MTFKEWPVTCNQVCGFKGKLFGWDYEIPLKCPMCGEPTLLVQDALYGNSASISTDEIPGGIEIRHGICNPDGTPRRFYSKTDIKRAANEAGYTISGDTPRPYKVAWSGKQKRIDGVKEH